MFIAYIDESGKHHVNHQDKEFILSAIIINENRWKKFNNRINLLKDELARTMTIEMTTQNDFEFHANQINRRAGIFKSINSVERDKIFNEIIGSILKNRCALISIIIDKSRVEKSILTDQWVETWAWRLMAERLENLTELRNTETDYPHKLMICMDNENRTRDRKISVLMQIFREEGSMVKNSKFIIENPFFVESISSNFIQLADVVAWLTRQWYKNEIDSSNKFHKNADRFNELLPKFAKNKTGGVMGAGIKIYP